MGRSTLKQLDPYLEYGHFVSADRTIDYADRLDEVKTPILMVAGDGDVMSDVPSTELTFDAIGSTDKTLVRFGLAGRPPGRLRPLRPRLEPHAPNEVFPALIDWLDSRQLPAVALPSPQVTASAQKSMSGQSH